MFPPRMPVVAAAHFQEDFGIVFRMEPVSANHRLLVLIAEFDRRKGWSDSATQSCAHWLNWKCGIDLGAAREKVRVASALTSLPRVAAAMARGEVSYSKVRAITRVATPATEELLLSIALHGTAHHVETTVRCFRRAKQAEELSREARQQAARRVTYSYDDDGSLIVKASLPAETGALFMKALDAALDAMEEADVSAETFVDATSRRCRNASRERNTARGAAGDALPAGVSAETSAAAEDPTPGERVMRSVRRADALARVAESFLAHGAKGLAAGERHQLVVHVDAQTLSEGCAGRCEHHQGPSLPAETARRLGCDASVVAIVEDENGTPLNVGRKTRTIPPAIHRALRSRDQRCRFPGCPNTHYVDGHHIHHWAQGGETKLSNLVLLCRFHHRQVHEGGVSVEPLADGVLRFKMKDGRWADSPVPVHPCYQRTPDATEVSQGDWTRLLAAHEGNQVVITPNTAVTRWRGERMDYGTAVDALLYRDARARSSATAMTVGSA